MQTCFPSALPKRVYQVPLRMYSKSSERKPEKHKKTSRDKNFQSKKIDCSPQKESLRSKEEMFCPKEFQLIKILNHPVLNHFFRFGSVLFSCVRLYTTTTTTRI